MKAIVTLAAALTIAGCTTLGGVPTQRLATADLRLGNGLPAGEAVLTAAGDKVMLTIAAVGLPQGIHGVHLHMVGACDAPAFTTAGGHLNPAGHQHDTLNPAGSHLGDLPNLVATTAGAAALTTELKASRAEAETTIFDSDGTAIVVHAGPDDYKTDPSGNSGARIACGVFKRS